MIIPDGVTSIGSNAFAGSKGLLSIAIPNTVSIIGQSAFSGCASLTSIAIPNGVAKIEDKTFYGCSGLTSLSIGNSVTRIGGSVFVNVKLRTIKCKAESAPELLNATVFSPQTLAHAALYVPEGSWYGYAFDDFWFHLENFK